jgi:hypothetical protein
LAALKEKVAVIREKANRVKLGVHFEQGSNLELPINHGSAEFGAYTDARLFFRTRRDTGKKTRNFINNQLGLLFYLGNEAKTNARYNDFMAVEIDQRRPRLIASLGREIVDLQLDE